MLTDLPALARIHFSNSILADLLLNNLDPLSELNLIALLTGAPVAYYEIDCGGE
jgi:hypothetical protein